MDASLLPTLSFPAFASHEERLVDLSKSNVVKRLRSKKGFKRFSRDGYLSRIEDKERRLVGFIYLASKILILTFFQLL